MAQLCAEVKAGHGQRAGQLGTADPRLLHLRHHESGGVVGDQVIDAGFIHIQAPAPAVALLCDAKVGALGFLGIQPGHAAPRVIQVTEGRRLERGAVAGIEAEAAAQVHAPAQAAGGVVAELFVVVVTQAGLQVVRAEPTLVLHEHAGVVAAVDQIARAAAIQVVLAPVHAGAEQLAVGDAHVGLHRGAVAVGLRGAQPDVVVVVVRLVVGTADVGGQGEALARRVADLAAQHLLQGFGVVVVAVVVVLAFGAQRGAFHAQAVGQRVAAAQAHRQVAVAVAVGFVGAAAGEGDWITVAGVDAVGVLVGDVGAEPAARAGAADAPDRIRTVQAGLGAAHDFHAFDLRQRQVLQHGQAKVAGVDAHAIDQHQGVGRIGAAQEQRALLAQSAAVVEVDAGAAAQQVLQRRRLAALDFGAVDHLRRRDAVLQGNRGARGGHQHLVQCGGIVLCGGHTGQRREYGEGKKADLQLHR